MQYCCYKGINIGVITALVTWHHLRPCWVRTKHFQTMFLIWIFISVKLSFQRYQIRPYLDILLFLFSMTFYRKWTPHRENLHHFQNFYHPFLSTLGHALTESKVKIRGALTFYGTIPSYRINVSIMPWSMRSLHKKVLVWNIVAHKYFSK